MQVKKDDDLCHAANLICSVVSVGWCVDMSLVAGAD